MKRILYILTLLLLLLSNGIHSQSWFYFTGKITDKEMGNPVPEYPVFISADDSLNSILTMTNMQGMYYDSLFLMPGQSVMVTVLDCHEEPHSKIFPNPDSINIADFSICVSEGDCFAWFDYEPDSVDQHTIMFYNLSEGNFTNWEWDFGDGSTSDEFNPVHYYEEEGGYQVCLTISDSTGSCWDTFCMMVFTGENNCKADFEWEPDTDNSMKIQFTDLSSGNNDYWIWDFGDGQESYEQNPSHVYNDNGQYLVTLVIYDSLGFCYDEASKWVEVNGEPACQADFSVTLDTLNNEPDVYIFRDLSQGKPKSWSWDFGDGNFSSEQNPIHTYEESGTYEVCLNVSFQDNCFDKKCKEITTPQYYDFGGQVFIGNFPINIEEDDSSNRAMAYLYRRYENKWELMDTREFWKFGYYWFTQKPEGEYIIRTDLLEGSPDYGHYAPAYHENNSFWTGATIFDLKDSEEFAVNIYLRETVDFQAGTSEIYGTLKTGASCNDGVDLENQLVYLLNDKNKVIAYTYSDKDGKFYFNGFGKGTYRVRAEITGKLSSVVNVVIDDSNPMPGEITLEIDCDAWVGIEEEIAEKENEIFISNIFPQPASGSMNVELTIKKAGNFQFEFIDLTGKAALSRTFRLTEGENPVTMDVSRFHSGLYLLKITGLNERAVVTQKILIR